MLKCRFSLYGYLYAGYREWDTTVHCKNGSGFPVPAEMSLTKLSLDVNNEFIPLASVLDVSPYTKPAIL
jgi:hypothetical protein